MYAMVLVVVEVLKMLVLVMVELVALLVVVKAQSQCCAEMYSIDRWWRLSLSVMLRCTRFDLNTSFLLLILRATLYQSTIQLLAPHLMEGLVIVSLRLHEGPGCLAL